MVEHAPFGLVVVAACCLSTLVGAAEALRWMRSVYLESEEG